MANEKTIDERIEALPDEVKNLKLPEEGLSDEFKHFAGKSLSEVFKSQIEAQAKMIVANQDKSTAEKLVAELEGSKSEMEAKIAELTKKPDPDPDPDPDLDSEYTYVTKADIAKEVAAELKKGDKSLTEEQITEIVNKKTIEAARGQAEVNAFKLQHPKVSEKLINTIIEFGIDNKAKDLNEAYEKYIGMAQEELELTKGESKTTPIPSQIESGVNLLDPETKEPLHRRFINVAQQGQISKLITPLNK